jgi:hypothetical protein
MVVKKAPPRDGVAFAIVVTALWHLRRLRKAAIGLVEVGSAQGTIAWVVDGDQKGRRSKCS